jgi:hypothetical protein
MNFICDCGNCQKCVLRKISKGYTNECLKIIDIEILKKSEKCGYIYRYHFIEEISRRNNKFSLIE